MKKRLTPAQTKAYNKFLKAITYPPFARTSGPVPPTRSGPKVPPGRESANYTSLVTSGGTTKSKEVLHYTGDKIKGISTMHKSNATPCFTNDEILDHARMRRN